MSLADLFRREAQMCDHAAAPLYGVLLRGFACDWEASGPLRDLCSGYEDARPSDAMPMRVLGAVHRLVLRREEPELALYFRTSGGTADPRAGDPGALAVSAVARHLGRLRPQLRLPPQTNEPGRAANLAVGLLAACDRYGSRRVRLLEVGASGGLNLHVDRFGIEGDGWHLGPSGSPVQLRGAVRGRSHPPLPFEVVARRGCDRAPVDVGSPEGRLWLTSFVWPDHRERHRRLAAALQVAAQHQDVVVDAADAGDWLRERLTRDPLPDGGVLTVVWHSVLRQYLDEPAAARLDDALAAGRRRLPLAHVAMELRTDAPVADTTLDGVVVATSPPHGPPVTMVENGAGEPRHGPVS